MNFTRTRQFLFAAAAAVGLSATVLSTPSNAGDDWQVPARATRKKNPLPRDDAISIEVGKAIYTKECAACHGGAGHGDGPSAARLSRTPPDIASDQVASQTDGSIFWKISEGHKPMPTFNAMISEDGRWHVVLYLRTIMPAKAATRPTTMPASRPAGQR